MYSKINSINTFLNDKKYPFVFVLLEVAISLIYRYHSKTHTAIHKYKLTENNKKML